MIIALLETDEQRQQMYRLVHDEYVRAGYICPRDDRKFIHHDGLWDRLPQTDVFLAYDDNGELIGTNSITRDNDFGIHTSVDFPAETMSERFTGKNLASSWRIVTREDCRKSSGTVAALIRASVQRCADMGIETVLFTFNPKHMCRYHIALNMEMIGFSKTTEGLRHAPSVLMRVYMKDIPARWFRE